MAPAFAQPLLEVFLKLELIVLREEKAINQRQGENRSPEAKHRDSRTDIRSNEKRVKYKLRVPYLENSKIYGSKGLKARISRCKTGFTDILARPGICLNIDR